MPHDPYERMFGDTVVRPVTRARLRRLLTLFSIVLHVVVIVPFAVAQLFAVGPLPIPRQPVIFEALIVHVMGVPLPPPAPSKGPVAPVTDSLNAAPTEAPIGVAPEPAQPIRSNASVGVVGGVDSSLIVNGLPGTTIDRVAPPAPAPQAPIRVHVGVQAPRKIVDVPPVYPAIAVAARKEGFVILEAIVDARGNIESLRVLRSDPLLEPAAIDAVRQWKYTPGLLNGVAVPIIMTVTVNFTLR